MISAEQARAQTSVTLQDALIKQIEREILEYACRGHKRYMSNIVLADSGMQFLRDNGYKVELCEDDKLKCLTGTIISWE
jgi:hypothetical protein